jgi:hypothetical protein
MDPDHDFIHIGYTAQTGGKKVRQSPSKSATLYRVGTKKRGNDANIWIIVENKNGVKKWQIHRRKDNKTKAKTKTKSKTKKKLKCSSPKRGEKVSKACKKKLVNISKMKVLDFYDVKQKTEDDLKEVIKNSSSDVKVVIKGIMKLIKDLRKLGKTAHIIPLPLSDGGIYWTDYAGDYLNEIYGNDWFDNHMYFTIYLNREGDQINTDREIGVSYSTLNRDEKIKVIELMEKHIPNRYSWRGSNTEKIFVQYEKGEPNDLDISKLKDNDTYPQFYVNINFNSKKINLFEDDKALVDKVVKQINAIAKVDFMDHEYGMHDMSIFLYSVDLKKREKIQNKIEELFDRMKGDKVIKTYSINFYESPE